MGVKMSKPTSSPTSPYTRQVLLRGKLTEEEKQKQKEDEEKRKSLRDDAQKKITNIQTGKRDGNYTFSGADCDVYVYRGGDNISRLKKLESIATVSISIYEAKAPVRRLGHASAIGFSGNIRSIAGSIISYLGDSHPLEKISEPKMEKHKDDYGNEFVSGRIKPFNMLLLYKNEVKKDYQVLIKNIEIISEGLVTSVNDMATEMVFQFVATEADLIKGE